jgi:hypothetical protein
MASKRVDETKNNNNITSKQQKYGILVESPITLNLPYQCDYLGIKMLR